MNCTTPESIKKTRKESINLRRSGVFSVYAFHNVSTALVVVNGAGFGAIVGRLEAPTPSSSLHAHRQPYRKASGKHVQAEKVRQLKDTV